MDAAVNPEVAAAEKAEAARKEELRKEQVKALAVSTTSSSSLPASMLSLLGKQMLHYFWLLLYTQHGKYRQQPSEHAQGLFGVLHHVACMPEQPFVPVLCSPSACS